jgi:hypothetical protein
MTRLGPADRSNDGTAKVLMRVTKMSALNLSRPTRRLFLVRRRHVLNKADCYSDHVLMYIVWEMKNDFMSYLATNRLLLITSIMKGF